MSDPASVPSEPTTPADLAELRRRVGAAELGATVFAESNPLAAKYADGYARDVAELLDRMGDRGE